LGNCSLIATSHQARMATNRSEIDIKIFSFYLKMLLCIRLKDSSYLSITFFPFNDILVES
jgi:hypothetical protein